LKFYKLIGKRLVDFLSALILLVLISPIVVGVIILMWFVNNGSVFFLQLRPGHQGKLFKIIKFKTMWDALEEFKGSQP
jgi:undecaprenyl phosphate N,N'-diacetylbacillosamine 1-phosphate transferase